MCARASSRRRGRACGSNRPLPSSPLLSSGARNSFRQMPWQPSGISPPVESPYKQSPSQQVGPNKAAPSRRTSMKQVLIERYGTPWEVARCAEVPDVGDPGPDEVVFDVLAFPINPADMGFCRGTYRLKPPLPATPGAECVGRVIAVGAAVRHVKVGDLVINLQRENWAQKRRVKGVDAIPLPAGIDLKQAAMLRINPPTAELMLSDFVPLKGGDWVIQNVANSAVGRLA